MQCEKTCVLLFPESFLLMVLHEAYAKSLALMSNCNKKHVQVRQAGYKPPHGNSSRTIRCGHDRPPGRLILHEIRVKLAMKKRHIRGYVSYRQVSVRFPDHVSECIRIQSRCSP